jgi:hypothetical protein
MPRECCQDRARLSRFPICPSRYVELVLLLLLLLIIIMIYFTFVFVLFVDFGVVIIIIIIIIACLLRVALKSISFFHSFLLLIISFLVSSLGRS